MAAGAGSRLGELIAAGRTSDVFRYGTDGAAKVLRETVPDHWAAVEATITGAVGSLGIPTAEVRELTVIDHRPAIVFGRIDGPTMWQRMLERRDDVAALARDLADLHTMIHSAGIPDGMAGLTERLAGKIDDAENLDSAERARARRVLAELPRGAALLHGDLHPGNVLLADGDPIVIDWFDAVVGYPAADIARTMLLIQPTGATDLRHLPGATTHVVETLSASYAERLGRRAADADIGTWRRLHAVARLAERTDLDTTGLLAIWRDDGSPHPPTTR